MFDPERQPASSTEINEAQKLIEVSYYVNSLYFLLYWLRSLFHYKQSARSPMGAGIAFHL